MESLLGMSMVDVDTIEQWGWGSVRACDAARVDEWLVGLGVVWVAVATAGRSVPVPLSDQWGANMAGYVFGTVPRDFTQGYRLWLPNTGVFHSRRQ